MRFLMISLATMFVAGACVTSGSSSSSSSTSSSSSSSSGAAHLDPPAAGAGWQWATGEFQVPAGTEEQDCYFFQVPGTGTDPIYVNRIVVAQNEGTHHMNVFRVKTIVNLDPANGIVQTASNGMGQCFKSVNWADWPLVINSQIGGENTEWTLPEGVAHKFVPGEWLMLQTHYVNATTQMTPLGGSVLINFYTQPAAEVQHELGTLFATKQSIRICQNNPTPTYSGSCQFNSATPINIVGANGHFHSRGREFDMYVWDGVSIDTPPLADRFYQSTEWDSPPMTRYPELNRQVAANGGVFYSCSYEWEAPPEAIGCAGLNAIDGAPHPGSPDAGTPPGDLDCCYTFSGIVDKGEHCNIFVYYYPKQDDINCF